MKILLPLVLLTLLAAGCSAGRGDGGPPNDETPPPTTSTPGTTGDAGKTAPREARDLRVVQLPSRGEGLQRRQVVLAPSAKTLSGAIGREVPNSGGGTYLAAFWGEKPTGGYSLTVRAARQEDGRVTVVLDLRNPPPDAIVIQALTYPYAVAVLRDVDLPGTDFSFTAQNDRKLDWPVRRVDG